MKLTKIPSTDFYATCKSGTAPKIPGMYLLFLLINFLLFEDGSSFSRTIFAKYIYYKILQNFNEINTVVFCSHAKVEKSCLPLV